MFSIELLQLFIYAVFAFSIVAYATLDGFDLGIGCLHLFAKGDNERRLMINSIGPVWDGNTTWIVIGGGILLAGFPKAFAILMSNLYTPMMALIFGFTMRGAAIEFRSKREGKKWRACWDIVFFSASLILAFTLGLLLGNMVRGLPLNSRGALENGLSNLLTPYPIIIALFGISIFMMHGSIYLLMKTEGALHKRIRKWVNHLILIFLTLWVVATVATFYMHSHMIRPFFKHPELGIFALISIGCIAAIPRAIKKRRDGWAFIFSCFAIVFLLFLYGIGTFPYLLYSTIDTAQNSLTLFNSSASRISLTVLVIIALLGLPLSFFYGSYVYKIFKGKIKLDPMSY